MSGAVKPGLVQALPAVHSLQSDKLSAPASALNLPLGQGVGVSVPASQKCLKGGRYLSSSNIGVSKDRGSWKVKFSKNGKHPMSMQ